MRLKNPFVFVAAVSHTADCATVFCRLRFIFDQFWDWNILHPSKVVVFDAEYSELSHYVTDYFQAIPLRVAPGWPRC